MFEFLSTEIVTQWMDAHLPPLILALMGGIADFLMSDDHSIANMFVGLFLAGFAGYIVLLLCIEWDISESWKGVTCGIAGMSSKVILQMFKKIVLDRLRMHLHITDGEDTKEK